MTELTLTVEGMSCDHCKSAVEKALIKIEAVESASVNLEEKQVTIRYDGTKANPEQLIEVIEEEGYEVLD
ncbi:heavy-metal-associated domain-containing protein [Heliorestis acidaminivorans]|uniref:Copper chaperone CopZ n=1 Tax=Heliorestis acidaminivorans TaxID=553427 RepID=A0A6I0F112_9FIRM|nr:cation transporter [Heliorestis acidaminivorans]KAB2951830.1 heavy-metal-associated domain-containing protein [Heliorestis acidaminivorans]